MSRRECKRGATCGDDLCPCEPGDVERMDKPIVMIFCYSVPEIVPVFSLTEVIRHNNRNTDLTSVWMAGAT